MDIELLHTFIEVSKTRHFGKAADNLFLTQSAISARIRTLETALNAQLFERTTKQVALTAEGEKFLKHAETILLAWTNAKLDVTRVVESDQLLSIGSTPGLWHYVFNKSLAELLRDSDIFINALSYSTEDLTRLLCSSAIDIVMLYEKINEPNIDAMEMGNLNLRLFSTDKISKKSELSGLSYIHVDWGVSFNQFINKHLKNELKYVMQTDNAQSAQHVLLEKGGAAYLPELLNIENMPLHCIDRAVAPTYKRKIYGCFNNNSIKKLLIKQTIDNLKIR